MLEPLQDLHYENMVTTGQDVLLHVGDQVGAFKVRYRIRANAYVDQSYAVAEVWSPATLSWNEVATYHPRLWWNEGLRFRSEADKAETLGDAQNELEARLRATLL